VGLLVCFQWRLLWWVDLALPSTHQGVLSLLLLLNRTGGGNKIEKLVGWDKDREIPYQLLSGAKHTWIY